MAELSSNVNVTLTMDPASYVEALESLRSEFATMIQQLRDEVAEAVKQIAEAKSAPAPNTHYHIDSRGSTDPTAVAEAVRQALRSGFASGGIVDAIGKPLPKSAPVADQIRTTMSYFNPALGST